MFKAIVLGLCAVIGTGSVLAQEPDRSTEPESLTTLRDQWAAKSLESARQLKEGYFGALEKLKARYTQGGRLEDAQRVQEEIERLTGVSKEAAEAREDDPLDLAELRVKFERTMASRTGKINDDYLAALKRQKGVSQREGILDSALAYAKEIERVETQPVAAQRETAPAGIGAVAVDWGALSPVAQKVRAKGSVDGAAEGVIAFDGPPGDGRRGAKGILVRPAGDLDGSTWSFVYTRGGSARGLQIIHPRGTGQAIIHVNKESIGLSRPGEWRAVGYGSGDTDAFKTERAFEETFPLQDGKEYRIVSRMNGNGSYEIHIDDRLVARANVGRASPLDFEIPEDQRFPGSSGHDKLIFHGEGFPLQWEANMAGLLLGPLDSGVHVCRDVQFGAGR